MILAQIGGIKIYYYAFFTFIAIILGSIFLVYRLKKYQIRIDYFDFLFWTILSGAIGSKLAYIVLYPHQFSWNIFYSGGAVSWGGIIFGIGAALIYLKIKKISILRFLDAGFIALLFGMGAGRFGSFLNGNGYGKITNSFLGVRLSIIDNYSRFPAEIIEAMLLFILIGIVLYLEKKKYFISDREPFQDGFTKSGFMFIIVLLAYALIRIMTDFLKDGFIRYWGVTLNQYFCFLLIILIFVVIIIKKLTLTGGKK